MAEKIIYAYENWRLLAQRYGISRSSCEQMQLAFVVTFWQV